LLSFNATSEKKFNIVARKKVIIVICKIHL